MIVSERVEQYAQDMFGKNILQLTDEEIRGIPRITKQQQKALFKLRKMYRDAAGLNERPKLPKIAGARDAFEYMAPDLLGLDHEKFVIIALNRANRATGCIEVSSGGVSGTVVDPKVLFKKALLCGACALILGHNHPSGNLRPSQADIDITRKLSQAGKTLDIRILDHLIIGGGMYYSFADEGLM